MLRAAIATALPFVALGALGWQAAERLAVTRDGAGAAIPMRSVDDLGQRLAKEHIRAELEAHRFAHGRYPEHLELLAQSAPSLAGEPLGDYYYAVRGDEVVLLAPLD